MRKLLLPFLLTAVMTTTACDDDDDPVTPINGITMTLGSENAAVLPGGTATVPITIGRTSGFTGSVTLTATGVPDGMTATFEPTNVAAGETSSILTLTASNTATTGGTITVRASGSGTAPRTVTLPVTVATSGITLLSGTATASAAQGNAISIPLVLTRVGDFAGDVTLAAEGLPTGVEATFTPATLSGTNRVTTLTLTPSATAAAGTANITIRGTGTGIGPSTQTLALTITPSTTAGFGFSSAPAALVVQAGQSVTSTLTITRTNSFAGNVALTATGAPEGLTVSFNPTTASNTATVTVSAAAGVAPGVYQISVSGASEGASNATTALTVIVTAASGG